MSPRAHIRHLQQAQIAQKTVQIEVRKEVEAFRANKAMAIEENLNEMLDSNEAGRSAHSQSQAWLLDKVDPQFVNLTNVNSCEEVICLLSSPAIPQIHPSQLLQMPLTSQSIHPQLLQISSSGIENSLHWSFGSPPNSKEDFNQDKQVALRKLLNQHHLSGWFESLEVEDYEPFDWEDSKGKRKADGCPE
ncbi:hypothetical protein BY996DRAFT_6419633 [Phakopsora pachyrhizi]|nr:hypothetical protein BY996DRAFT_6419633 [Phakopsora pachyrhizi]